MVAKRINLLVTGATGRVGRKLLAKIDRDKYRVSVLVRRVSDKSSLAGCRVVEGDLGQFDGWESEIANEEILVHLAARVDMFASDVERINFEGTKKLVESMPRIKKVIFVSSIEACGPTGEKAAGIGETERPVCPYGKSKLMAEQWLTGAAKKRGFECLILRLGNVVGFEGDMLSQLKGESWLVKCGRWLYGDFEIAPIDIGEVVRVILAGIDNKEVGVKWVVGKSVAVDEICGRKTKRQLMPGRGGLIWLMRKMRKGGLWMYLTLGGVNRRYRRYA